MTDTWDRAQYDKFQREREQPFYDLPASIRPGPVHWVEEHERPIPQLAAILAPSGQLAFQVPAQHDTLTNRIADELATVEPSASAFGGWRQTQPALPPDG
jgi:trans-aconitate 2-methyltransferase